MSLPPLSLYVHFPWCVRKCPYCDFNSHTLHGELPEEQYVEALLRDLALQTQFAQGRALQSIFLGGGTPSLFSPVALSRLVRLSGLGGAPAEGLSGLELLEELGRRFYGLAVDCAPSLGAPSTVGLRGVDEIAQRFPDARRALNVVTDWYLFPLRGRWFGPNGE